MGFAVGTTCYRSPDAAANANASQMQGVTTAGVVAVDSISPVSGQTFEVGFSFEGAASSVQRTVEVVLPECEPFDVEGAAPMLWSILAASILILSLRRLAALFHRETL